MHDEFGQECLCGSTRFERVIVERPPGPPIVTDFIACLCCKTMLHHPHAAGRNSPPAATDPHTELMRDVRIAALDYRKPGRRKR